MSETRICRKCGAPMTLSLSAETVTCPVCHTEHKLYGQYMKYPVVV